MVYYYNYNGGILASSTEIDELELVPEEEAVSAIQLSKNSPPTPDYGFVDVAKLIIANQINTIRVDDSAALRMVDYYPAYEQLVANGETAAQGFRFSYNGKLYRTMQPAHTFDGQFAPGVGTESLYSEVTLPDDGTAGCPIAYNGNMALEQGKYYAQDGIVYLCIRDTGAPVFNPLSDLIGIYVERSNPYETE